MEHCPYDLFGWIQKAHRHRIPRAYPDGWLQHCAKIFLQICTTVMALHRQGICHLDLSLENILLVNVKDPEIRIIDFGVSQKFARNWIYNKPVGKTRYMPPEVSFLMFSIARPFFCYVWI